MAEDIHNSEHESAILREASYVVRRAELEEVMGNDAKPWQESEDEPLTMADYRRFPAGSDERELILMHVLLDLWQEIDHIRQHVCPNAEDIEDDDDYQDGDAE